MISDDEYLDMIKETYGPDCEDDVLFCMVGIAGEAGEIANLAQKGMRGDFRPDALGPEFKLSGIRRQWEFDEKVAARRQQLIEEMGGLYYFFRALCWRLGITPAEVAQINAEKLRGRLARGTIRGDGDAR